ncbi:hypothetical protein MTO96_001063 [Rhipicephalus appendiculatus]
MTYESGMVRGTLSRDDLGVAGVSVRGQLFGEITHTTGDVFKVVTFDGIFGLGYPDISEKDVVPPFDNMIKQELVTEPLFSMFLSSTPSQQDGGEILFGGVNSERYTGDIAYTDVTKKGYWQFSMDGYVVAPQKQNFTRRGAQFSVFIRNSRTCDGKENSTKKLPELFAPIP